MARKRTHNSPPPAAAAGYTVLARRYRPQRFEEVIGQEAIAQALQGAIRAGRVGHAYLFAGPRGVGKTTMARIFARALNCARGPTTEPCGQCDSCCAIATGEDIDVLEIDGASNRGIEEVRELRQNAYYRPSRSRYKIYIIDEVHMLTREAFNALLKILEEPPPHVKFIFATTDPQKIPPTILSRCQRYSFGGIPPEQMRQKLQQILRQEQVSATDEALELVVRRAAGSLRDALSLLDQLLAFGGKQIDADRVHRLLGTLPEEALAALVDRIVQRDAAGVLKALEDIEQRGVRAEELLGQLLEYFRELAAVKAAGSDAPLAYVGDTLRQRLLEQAESMGLENILAAADILIEARARLRASQLGRTVTELALMRLATLTDLRKLSALIASLQDEAAPPAQSTLKKNGRSAEVSSAATSSPPHPHPAPPPSWPQLFEQLKPHLSPLLRTVLEDATVECSERTLTLTLNASSIAAARLEELGELLRSRLPPEWAVQLKVAKGTHADPKELRRRAVEDPLIQGIQQLFGARILKIEPNSHDASHQ